MFFVFKNNPNFDYFLFWQDNLLSRLSQQSSLASALTAASRQIEHLQSSVQFQNVNQMQSELNNAREERAVRSFTKEFVSLAFNN